jgi:hypothetical protein
MIHLNSKLTQEQAIKILQDCIDYLHKEGFSVTMELFIQQRNKND